MFFKGEFYKKDKRKMMEKDLIYVDASCRENEDIGSWAVVTENKQYSGLIGEKNLHSFYCELYAVYQALLLSKESENVVIYCDNQGVVRMLNKDMAEFTEVIDFSKKRDHNFLHEVYYSYQDMPNVEICKIDRSNNKVADKVARNMLMKGVYTK